MDFTAIETTTRFILFTTLFISTATAAASLPILR